jgi:DNA polymerase phi
LFASPSEKKGHTKKKIAEDPANQSEDEPIDLLVDTLIGFLEKPNSYMKAVAGQVFALLSGCVKASTIGLILTVCLLL